MYWPSGDRSAWSSEVQVTFGSNVPESEQTETAKNNVLQAGPREYEIIESDTTSVVGNPKYTGDRAYLGHVSGEK